MKKQVALLSIIGGLVVAIAFNNCSPEHAGSADGFSILQELNFVPCAFPDEKDLFSKTYLPFLTRNCATCHIPGGEGKGVFASGNLQTAYDAFTVTGYDLINENAISISHEAPYTGSQHLPIIDLLQEQWVRGLENIAICQAGGGVPDPIPIDENTRLETRSKAINTGTIPVSGSTPTVTISWNLPTEILNPTGAITLPNIAGTTLSANIRAYRLGSKVVYEITEPRLKATTTTDVKIQSLLVKINGRLIRNQTTYRYIDVGVFRGEDVRLAPGAMVVDGAVAETDVISISIGKLEALTLPPRPVFPRVRFVTSAVNVNENVTGVATTSNNNFAQVNLELSSPYDQYVTVTISLSAAALAEGETALNRRSTTIRVDNVTLVIDLWDWDFSVDTQSVVFAPGETSKSLNVRLSNDQRDERNEKIQFVISSAVNATKDIINQMATLTIVDDDAAPNPEIPTFSSLMQTGGVLSSNCLACHNSSKREGGYTLSDYDLMIENRVLVPYSINSDMYKRMSSQTQDLRPMPLNGLLDFKTREPVELWILNGARND